MFKKRLSLIQIATFLSVIAVALLAVSLVLLNSKNGFLDYKAQIKIALFRLNQSISFPINIDSESQGIVLKEKTVSEINFVKIEGLDLYLDNADLIIKKADENKISYSFYEGETNEPFIDMSSDKISITMIKQKVAYDKRTSITISVKDDLDTLKLHNYYGNNIIEDVNISSIDLTLLSSSLKMSKVSSKDAFIGSSKSSLLLEDLNIKAFTILNEDSEFNFSSIKTDRFYIQANNAYLKFDEMKLEKLKMQLKSSILHFSGYNSKELILDAIKSKLIIAHSADVARAKFNKVNLQMDSLNTINQTNLDIKMKKSVCLVNENKYKFSTEIKVEKAVKNYALHLINSRVNIR